MYDIGGIWQTFIGIGRRSQTGREFDIGHVPGVAVIPVYAVCNFFVSDQNGGGEALSSANGRHGQPEISTSHDGHSDGIGGTRKPGLHGKGGTTTTTGLTPLVVGFAVLFL